MEKTLSAKKPDKTVTPEAEKRMAYSSTSRKQGQRGCCPFPLHPKSPPNLPPLRSGQSRLTIPNTSSTITMPASLRSDCCSPSLRNAVRLPSGIDVHLHRNTQGASVAGLGGLQLFCHQLRPVVFLTVSELYPQPFAFWTDNPVLGNRSIAVEQVVHQRISWENWECVTLIF